MKHSHNSSRSNGVLLNKLLNKFGFGGGGHTTLGSKNSDSISDRLLEPVVVDRYNFCISLGEHMCMA